MLSKRLSAFERAFEVLNGRFFESSLSKPVITISPSARSYGHFTPYQSWKDAAGGYYEINLSAETINRPFEYVIATLLHEMIHQYCHENGISDTSRGGAYHNKRFRDEAVVRGLVITYDATIGWSRTKPSIELIEFIATGVLKGVKSGLHRLPQVKQSVKQSSKKYVCPSCGCIVRATKHVNISCLDCGRKMEISEK
jgi:hypothetical protein